MPTYSYIVYSIKAGMCRFNHYKRVKSILIIIKIWLPEQSLNLDIAATQKYKRRYRGKLIVLFNESHCLKLNAQVHNILTQLGVRISKTTYKAKPAKQNRRWCQTSTNKGQSLSAISFNHDFDLALGHPC